MSAEATETLKILELEVSVAKLRQELAEAKLAEFLAMHKLVVIGGASGPRVEACAPTLEDGPALRAEEFALQREYFEAMENHKNSLQRFCTAKRASLGLPRWEKEHFLT